MLGRNKLWGFDLISFSFPFGIRLQSYQSFFREGQSLLSCDNLKRFHFNFDTPPAPFHFLSVSTINCWVFLHLQFKSVGIQAALLLGSLPVGIAVSALLWYHTPLVTPYTVQVHRDAVCNLLTSFSQSLRKQRGFDSW